MYEQQTVRVPDMAQDQRWPKFAAAAAQAGAGSMLSIQLWVEGDNLGALNLYSRQVNAFDDESEQVGLLFASHAAVAFADARDMDRLRLRIRPGGNPSLPEPGPWARMGAILGME